MWKKRKKMKIRLKLSDSMDEAILSDHETQNCSHPDRNHSSGQRFPLGKRWKVGFDLRRRWVRCRESEHPSRRASHVQQ